MKKLCAILSALLLLSQLSGCSIDITVRDENGSSIPLPDNPESIIEDLTTGITTTTASDSDNKISSTDAATTTTATEAEQKKTNATTNKSTTSTEKPTSSTTSTTTSTAKATNSTSATKKDYGTPNINGTFHDDMAKSVLDMLNEARKDANLNELTMDNGNMMNAAKIRAKEITVHWAHERPNKEDSWHTVFDQEGVKYNARSENLADGYQTAEAVFNGWMNSDGHRQNIMEPRFTHISIACLEYEGHFYWVQLFGANIKSGKNNYFFF